MMEIVAFLVTVFGGYVGTSMFGDWLNWPQAGPIFAVAVMGCFILRAIRKRGE